MKTICWFEDVWGGPDRVPNVAQAQERRFDGRNAGTLCFNNPNYRNWLLGTVEDYARSYEIDGIMWGSERQGAFANALSAAHGGTPQNPTGVTCFCELCERKARERGINVDAPAPVLPRSAISPVRRVAANGRWMAIMSRYGA